MDKDNSVSPKTAKGGGVSSPIPSSSSDSDGNASSSPSSASSSSDVERMLRKVRKRKEEQQSAAKSASCTTTRKRRSSGLDGSGDNNNRSSRPTVNARSSNSSGSSSDDTNDDDDDDSDNNGGRAGQLLEGRYAAATASAGRRRKNARAGAPQARRSVASELAQMERRDFLQRRARERRDQKGRRRGSGDSSSDSDASVREEAAPQRKPRDRNAISIVMECTVEGAGRPPPPQPHNGVKQQEVISVDDDSSSSADEGGDATKIPVALPQSAVLTELAKAAAALQQAQQADFDQTTVDLPCADPVQPSPHNPSMLQPPIHLVVVAERERPGTAEVFEPQTLSLSIRRLEPLSALIGLVLDSLSLTPATAIVHLTSSQHQTLHPRHTAESYHLSPGCTIRAKALLKGLGHGSGTGSGPAAASLGRGLTLKFRRPNGTEVTVEARSKEPLQAVADRFRLQASLPPATQLSLRFDGAPIPLHQTPEALDMESDDLIDVVET